MEELRVVRSAVSVPPVQEPSESRWDERWDDRWDEIIRRHDGSVRGRVRRMLVQVGIRPRRDLVEEIVQEVYCGLLVTRPPRLGRGTEPQLISYLGLAAESRVVDHVRQVNAEKRSGCRHSGSGRRVRRRMEDIPDPGGTPEDAVLWAERQRLFLRFCASLPSRRLRHSKAWVMRLAVFEGWSSREISRAAGGRITPAGVDCLVHRVRRRLARDGFAPAWR